MYYINENIKDLYRVKFHDNREGVLRLDMNENPGGLPEKVFRRVMEKITPEYLATYPQKDRLMEAIAKHDVLLYENISVTAGSDEAMRLIFQCFAKAGGKVVTVAPTFEMYDVYAKMFGMQHVMVEYHDDFTVDVNDICKEIDTQTNIVVLLNPNSPIGTVYQDNEIEEIIRKAQEMGAVVVIDEAYHYFYPKTFIKYALTSKHILVTRTFSKLFSMAGCRLGYVVGHPDEIKMVQKLCTPHNTNAFAMLVAQKILETPGILSSLIEDYTLGRDYLIKELNSHKYLHKGDAGNFIFIKPKTNALTIVEKMKSQKQILIKSYSNVGNFGTCLRVTIGAKQYMERFLDALFELDNTN